jgi:hypothetical protein
VVRTVQRKTPPVAQDAKDHQRPLDVAAPVEVEEGIRQGLEDANKGKRSGARLGMISAGATPLFNSRAAPLCE